MQEETLHLNKNAISSQLDKGRSSILNNLEWGEDFHYRALFEQTADCVFVIGLDFTYIAVNKQATNLLGYSEEELIGRSINDIIALDESLGQVSLIDEQANLLERILRRKDGSTVPVEISTSIIYNKEGAPAYIQSIARDISERKKAENALIIHDSILAAISDAAAQLMCSSDIEKNISEVLASLGAATDVACCSIFEINIKEEKIEKNISYLWNKPGSSAIELENVIEIFSSQILESLEGIFVKSRLIQTSEPNNIPLSLAIVPIKLSEKYCGFLGLFDLEKSHTWFPAQRDAIRTSANLIGATLQRNRYEETIRESEARNRAIIEALPDLVIRIDIGEKILDYSARWDHPLYINEEFIAGKMLSEIWPEEIVRQIIGKNTNNLFLFPHLLEEFTLPNSKNIYESRLEPISPREALIVIRDITNQAELKQMKSDFINRASHELRTPLTSAIMMVDLIQSGGTPQELEEYWSILNSELNRQKILIDRLLIAGRLESGMMNLEIVPTDLVAILEESVRAVKPIANKKKITLNLELPAQAITIMGDKSGLQQVFINLINNATKFSPSESIVTINVSIQDKDIHVAITDQGMGIPADDIPNLFERFYRGRNVTIAEIPGSGVGLYIVKTIVQQLGGSINIYSTPNVGSTFTVVLKSAD